MITNHQRRVHVALAPLEQYFGRLLRMLGLSSDAASVRFVDDSQMARWNRTYRGKQGSTDVLSFSADERTDRSSRTRRTRNGKATVESVARVKYLGDIAISPVVARQNARRFRRTLAQELQILILHGLLHLMGYDHERDHGEMEHFESQLRVRLGLI
ncbi:MAG: rRNA maturation RNase YbeY [Candidatus Acidiferrales bacterium]